MGSGTDSLDFWCQMVTQTSPGWWPLLFSTTLPKHGQTRDGGLTACVRDLKVSKMLFHGPRAPRLALTSWKGEPLQCRHGESVNINVSFRSPSREFFEFGCWPQLPGTVQCLFCERATPRIPLSTSEVQNSGLKTNNM